MVSVFYSLATSVYTTCSAALSSVYNSCMQDKTFTEISSFGPLEWSAHAGLDVGAAEPSKSLLQIGDHPSPFFPGYTIRQTHILCCIPKDLSAEKLYEVFGKNTDSLDAAYKGKNPKTYWCWVAKKPALVSFPSLAIQEQELKKNEHEVPFLLEVAVAIFAARKLNDLVLFPDQDQTTNCIIGHVEHASTAILGGDRSKVICGYADGWRSPGIASVIREKK